MRSSLRLCLPESYIAVLQSALLRLHIVIPAIGLGGVSVASKICPTVGPARTLALRCEGCGPSEAAVLGGTDWLVPAGRANVCLPRLKSGLQVVLNGRRDCGMVELESYGDKNAPSVSAGCSEYEVRRRRRRVSAPELDSLKTGGCSSVAV